MYNNIICGRDYRQCAFVYTDENNGNIIILLINLVLIQPCRIAINPENVLLCSRQRFYINDIVCTMRARVTRVNCTFRGVKFVSHITIRVVESLTGPACGAPVVGR